MDVVWFWKVGHGPEKRACRKHVPSPDSNTTNLFYHLRKNHEKQHGESLRMKSTKASSAQNKPQTVQEAFARGTPYDKDSRRWKEITAAIAIYTCKDMAPIYTVEKQGFRELVRTLDPRYTMQSRKYFTRIQLPHLYQECRAKVEEEIHKVLHYAVATDMWSSRTTHPYMSLTIHFIWDWTLCSRCLQASYFPDDHTGEIIARDLREALESWGLREDHLVYVTTDNATNNILALRLNDWTRLQCFGHRLHLAIGECLKQCKNIFQ